jgi:hypothetical protein
MATHITHAGAPDEELRTSPIFDEYDDISLDFEFEASACYFNSVAYPIGQYLLSGDELLHCEGRGIWIRRGEMRPE